MDPNSTPNAPLELECLMPRVEDFDIDYQLNGSMENLPSDKLSGTYYADGHAVKLAGEHFKLTHHVTKRTFALAKITQTTAMTFGDFTEAQRKVMLADNPLFTDGMAFTKYNYDIVADVAITTVERPEYLYGATFLVLSPEHRLSQGVSQGFAGCYAINPLSHDKIPVWVADYTAQDVHLAVPAHQQADRDFAHKHHLPSTPVVAQDFGERLDDAKEVSGVVVIGYDPKTRLFMGLKNGTQGWLVGGGHEEGETYEQTARRELAEEAGCSKVIKLIELGDPVYSYYYNDIKQSNRRSLGYNYLAVVDPDQMHEQRQEAHESFDVRWTTYDDLYDDIAATGGGVEHWLEALSRAKAAAEAHRQGHEYAADCFTGEGTLVNSGPYDGLRSTEARKRIIYDLQTRDK